MKKLVIMMMLLAFVGVNVAIADDVVVYENSKGNVTFNHKEHQDRLGDCAKCHEGEPAKIEVNKEFAHGFCKDCHKEMNGPVKCNDCHKKE
ncbi:MAG: cytochrome c3 family protein [Deltaproteobacteria bacterium]|jgi:cytochrome c553|nr:cytochrome c3 family protein [Deltaproteobacteria bacterium]